MKLKELVTHIAQFEGKKHQASVGDIREIVGILSDVFFSQANDEHYEGPLLFRTLLENGDKRSKKKPLARVK